MLFVRKSDLLQRLFFFQEVDRFALFRIDRNSAAELSQDNDNVQRSRTCWVQLQRDNGFKKQTKKLFFK